MYPVETGAEGWMLVNSNLCYIFLYISPTLYTCTTSRCERVKCALDQNVECKGAKKKTTPTNI